MAFAADHLGRVDWSLSDTDYYKVDRSELALIESVTVACSLINFHLLFCPG